MATATVWFRRDDGSKVNRFFYVDTQAEMLTSTLLPGDYAYAVDVDTFYVATDSTTWNAIGGAGAFVKIIGDTMTGSLTINPSSGNDALIIQAGKRLVFDGE